MDGREEQLATVASLYYKLDRSQAEIAERFGVSTSKISRMLREARDRGIVEIRVHMPIPRDVALEQELCAVYGLRDALVLQSGDADDDSLLSACGNLAAGYLQRAIPALPAGASIGVAWGRSVYAAISAAAVMTGEQIDVIQLIGGVGSENVDSPDIARILATKLGGRHYDLPAPIMVKQSESLEILLGERPLREALERGRRVKLAVAGIGAVDEDASSFLRAGLLTRDVLADLRDQGAVGEMVGRFYKLDGTVLGIEINRRVIGIELDDLRRIPNSLAVARGSTKVEAIVGALRGRLITVLVTDDETARGVLAYSQGARRFMSSTSTTASDAALEAALDSFDTATRSAALNELLEREPFPAGAWQPVCNMHCHTFFSFNTYGYSPTALAWLARTQRWPLMGLIDFDVLDGVDEFLEACDATGVRGSCGIETRVFFPEFATRETSSPGEPGVTYLIGLGFTSSAAPAVAQPMLAQLRAASRTRNLGVVERVNAHLAPVVVDYERDVLPLTPNGNATERHIVEAYLSAAQRGSDDVAGFWAEKLGMTRADVEKMMASPAAYRNTVRSKLMKKGGVGYVQPGSGSFPTIDEVTEFIVQCGALPCVGWVDGFSEGEQAGEELLNTLVNKGFAIANIVPDRNWNFADPAVRAAKAEKLDEFIAQCQALDLPLNIGTEMNSPGNKRMDDFDVPEMDKHRAAFLDGAYFIYGHTVMQRHVGLGYQSRWAQQHMPTRRARNDFYTAIGKAVAPGTAGAEMLHSLDATMTPAEILARVA